MSCGCEAPKSLACTLGPTEFRSRLATIRDLAGRALLRRRQVGLRLELAYDLAAEREIRELVALERQCCAFLDFVMTREEAEGCLLVTITAPPEAADAVAEIFSEFAGAAVATREGDRGDVWGSGRSQ
jgi:hypothetical protein